MNEHIEDILVGGRPMTKLERANKEIERLNNILIEIKEIINNKYWFNWEYENDEVIKDILKIIGKEVVKK